MQGERKRMADVACVDLFCGAVGLTHGLISEGVRVSLTTTNRRCKGGQFILHATALPGNPHDGHTPKDVIQETEALTGREIERVYVDKGIPGTRRAPAKPGLPLRSEAWRPRPNQEGTPTPKCHQGRYRPQQDRWPTRPQLPERPPRRPDQRHHERRRLQLPTHPQMAEASLAQNHRSPTEHHNANTGAQIAFLTVDQLFPSAPSRTDRPAQCPVTV